MIQIFQPLKVRYSDTTCIEKHIRYDIAAFFSQNILSVRCDWSVGALGNQPTVNMACIVTRDHLLVCSRYEYVALFQENVSTIGLVLW